MPPRPPPLSTALPAAGLALVAQTPPYHLVNCSLGRHSTSRQQSASSLRTQLAEHKGPAPHCGFGGFLNFFSQSLHDWCRKLQPCPSASRATPLARSRAQQLLISQDTNMQRNTFAWISLFAQSMYPACMEKFVSCTWSRLLQIPRGYSVYNRQTFTFISINQS